jgi:simple sugar transport system ATP-binding protein
MTAITKRFGGIAALDNADILVRRGSVHGLLGENGAGKTTLMRIAYGLLKADAGAIRVNGQDVAFGSPSDAIAAGIGMVHQHPTNVSAMTVAENLELGGHGLYQPARAQSAAAALADTVGFSIDPSARVGNLPVAAQQRLEILRAIGRDARLLILDEPTAVLAPADAADLLRWLRTFALSGGTVVIITHKLEEARSVADDLTVLRGGHTILSSRSAATAVASLAVAMLGETPATDVSLDRRPSTGEVVARASDVAIAGDGGAAAIHHATFDIRRAEIVGVAGVEGSGHRELLEALAGRRRPDAGTLVIPSRTAFVPEDRHRDAVVLDFSLTENVAIHDAGSRRGRVGWRSMAQRTAGLMNQFDVRAQSPRTHMASLSGGNQQKMVLARELDANPELLVVENPTRGLDIRASAFVRQQIRFARDSGVGIVLYSSDLDELMEIADRILVVHAGTVSPAVTDRSAVGALMLGLT